MDWNERKQYYTPNYFDGGLPGHYTEWWWTDFAVWGPRARVIYEAFRPKRALECGCAKGSLVKFLYGIYGVDAIGLDLSEYAINTTPYPEIRDRLYVLDIAVEKLPFDNKEFDIVISFDFLEHIDDDHIIGVVEEMGRVSKSYILIRAPFWQCVPDPPLSFHREVVGLPFLQRMQLIPNWEASIVDARNQEHPNAMPRNNMRSLFPGFEEIYLDSYFYDIQMGSDAPKRTPVIPFYDTMVLKRES